MHTYSPVLIPLNWKSELVKNNSERVNVLKPIFDDLPYVDFIEVDWPIGYGTLEHDHLPVFFQPTGVVKLFEMCEEHDVMSASLYLYDNCLAVLHVELNDLPSLNDSEVTTRINNLSKNYLSPLFKILYEIKPSIDKKIIRPSEYKIFHDSEESLCGGKPLWVARSKVTNPSTCDSNHDSWLQNIDSSSELLLLGSGNSLVCDEKYFDDFHRVMVLSQFHAALMCRIEIILKESLIAFNQFHYKKKDKSKIIKNLKLHQIRNDHIEYIIIQFSSAQYGVQGKRRKMLEQFAKAWAHEQQRQRIERLAQLLQNRLSRFADQKLAEQSRGIKTVLAFLAALNMLSLVGDLNSINISLKNERTYGLLGLFHIVNVENMLNIITLAIIFVTIYFYRNHER